MIILLTGILITIILDDRYFADRHLADRDLANRRLPDKHLANRCLLDKHFADRQLAEEHFANGQLVDKSLFYLCLSTKCVRSNGFRPKDTEPQKRFVS